MIRAVAFDFDGVIVESVSVKTQAFARLFQGEGPEVVAQVVAYHLAHGGVSRVEKIRHYYREILRRPLPEAQLEALCEEFQRLTFAGVVDAPWVPGALETIRELHARDFTLFVVSGTPEPELREIVERRDLTPYFSGVFGSPRTKDVVLSSLLGPHLPPDDLLFVGDAMTDYDGATAAGVRFVARATAEGPDWSDLGVPVLPDLVGLSRVIADFAERA